MAKKQNLIQVIFTTPKGSPLGRVREWETRNDFYQCLNQHKEYYLRSYEDWIHKMDETEDGTPRYGWMHEQGRDSELTIKWCHYDEVGMLDAGWIKKENYKTVEEFPEVLSKLIEETTRNFNSRLEE